MSSLRHITKHSRKLIHTTTIIPTSRCITTSHTPHHATANTSTKSKPNRQQYDWLPISSTLQPHTNSAFPATARIVEVGPRDGLQNEAVQVPTHVKVELIDRLSQTGLNYIEATSFVSPKWVPQMADNAAVLSGIKSQPHITYPVLTPNLQGLNDALKCQNVTEIAIFASASEAFSQANINCSIHESIERFRPIIALAKQHNVRVRGYVSCVLGCPYEGLIKHDAVEYVSKQLLELGCYEISLGDTIGIGSAGTTSALLHHMTHNAAFNPQQLAVHFHDTYGQALNNIYIALQHGINVIDSSVSGLGGCPYAKGATGNVATEDVLYMLNGLGIHTGVDLQKVIQTSWWISEQLGRVPASTVSKTFGNRAAAATAAKTSGQTNTAVKTACDLIAYKSSVKTSSNEQTQTQSEHNKRRFA